MIKGQLCTNSTYNAGDGGKGEGEQTPHLLQWVLINNIQVSKKTKNTWDSWVCSLAETTSLLSTQWFATRFLLLTKKKKKGGGRGKASPTRKMCCKPSDSNKFVTGLLRSVAIFTKLRVSCLCGSHHNQVMKMLKPINAMWDEEFKPNFNV